LNEALNNDTIVEVQGGALDMRSSSTELNLAETLEEVLSFFWGDCRAILVLETWCEVMGVP
jgi:hypothetical protein